MEWKAKGAPNWVQLPLYRLRELMDSPGAAVVLVEGEKAADKAQAALGARYVVTTTAVGAAMWGNTTRNNYEPLQGREVIVWRDNDTTGQGAMEKVLPVLASIGARVRVVAIPEGKPEKWDAADATDEETRSLVANAKAPEQPAGSKLEHNFSKPPTPLEVWEVASSVLDPYLMPSGELCVTKNEEELREIKPLALDAVGVSTEILRRCKLTVNGKPLELSRWQSQQIERLAKNEATKIAAVLPYPQLNRETGLADEAKINKAAGVLSPSGKGLSAVDLDEAKHELTRILEGFDFDGAASRSHAIQAMLLPAIKDLYRKKKRPLPFVLVEANERQAGKEYFVEHVVGPIYATAVNAITKQSGGKGVGSDEEKLNHALIDGQGIISFSNVRGEVNSQFLESFITARNEVTARGLYCKAKVSPQNYCFFLTANHEPAPKLTKDLISRSLPIKILKRPKGYSYPKFEYNGKRISLASYTEARAQEDFFHLRCVYACVMQFVRANEDWEQMEPRAALRWITENVFAIKSNYSHEVFDLTRGTPLWQALHEAEKNLSREWVGAAEFVKLASTEKKTVQHTELGRQFAADEVENAVQILCGKIERRETRDEKARTVTQYRFVPNEADTPSPAETVRPWQRLEIYDADSADIADALDEAQKAGATSGQVAGLRRIAEAAHQSRSREHRAGLWAAVAQISGTSNRAARRVDELTQPLSMAQKDEIRKWARELMQEHKAAS